MAILVRERGSGLKAVRPTTIRLRASPPCDRTHHRALSRGSRQRPPGCRGDLSGRSSGMVDSPNPKLASHRLNRERSSGSSGEAAASVAGAAASFRHSPAPVAEPGDIGWGIPNQFCKGFACCLGSGFQHSRMKPQFLQPERGCGRGARRGSNRIALNMLVWRSRTGSKLVWSGERCCGATIQSGLRATAPSVQGVARQHPNCGAISAIGLRGSGFPLIKSLRDMCLTLSTSPARLLRSGRGRTGSHGSHPTG